MSEECNSKRPASDGTSEQSRNLTWHHPELSRADRETALGQSGCIVWLTGLSGAGKSTIARELERRLVRSGHWAYVLDGDNLRHGLNADLGFEQADRAENIRRAGEVTAILADAGLISIAAFISPYREGRDDARKAAEQILGSGRWFEVYLEIDVEACRRRDPKGLYRKADAGHIRDFTGVDAPYEAPDNPALILQTEGHSVDSCVQSLVQFLTEQGVLGPDPREGSL